MPLAHRKPTCDSATQVIWEDSTILGKTCVYEYDKAGNITKKYIYALTAANTTPQNPEETYIYGYGDADWGDKLTSYRGESITYDEIGNPLSYYNGKRYTFTWENGRRLATATVDGVTLTFTYNAEGIRTSKTVGGTEHTYHLNGSQIITETRGRGQSVIIYLYDAEGSPIGMKYRDGNMAVGEFEEYWFEKNLQGDIVAVYNAAGTKLISYTYDAWGNFVTTYHNDCTASHHANLNPFRYRGYYYDSELGMYYLQSRYYDPVIGRFINADSVVSNVGGNIIGCNTFAYCFNSPIALTDSSGNWPTINDVVNGIKTGAKWILNNIIDPVVKGAQDTLSNIDVTTSPGLTKGYNFLFVSLEKTDSIAIDTKGNIGLQTTFTLHGNCGFSFCGFGGPSGMISNAPTIYDLEGFSIIGGGSVFMPAEIIPVGGGVDVNWILRNNGEKPFMGLSYMGGVASGCGFELHSGASYTFTCFSFNVFEVYDSFYNAINGW